MMEFSKALRVRILSMVKSSLTISTMRMPARCAITLRRESAAGMVALSGSARPRASTMAAMVEAVPIGAQCPTDRDIAASASINSS